MEFTAQQIAAFLKGTVEGDPEVKVCTFSKIEEAQSGSITFLANPKYAHYIYETEASIVLVNQDFVPEKPIKATRVRVANAYASLAMLLTMVEQAKPKKIGVDANASIAASASLGEDCYVGSFAYIGEGAKIGAGSKIYPFAYIGDNVTVGDNCIVYPHVSVYADCRIGDRCIIHSGAVIGSDGFGFAPDGESYNKIPQVGNVVLEEDVEIGANTAIDRAVMGSTVIRKGVKLDNLIQIAHNVEIGENTVMASQVGIAGSTKVGKHCVFGGQVGLGGHITIGDNVSLGAQSGVISNLKAGSNLMGSPAMEVKTFFKSSAVMRRLPDIYKSLGDMQREIEQLKEKLNNQ